MKAVVLLVALVGLAALAALLLYTGASRAGGADAAARLGKVPIGVLGDSDSRSYQGTIPFTPGDEPAGGAYHAATLQWPEVLARMRGDQVDLGDWAAWGVPRWMSLARLRDGLGQRWRGPRKEDYRHNLAWPSGCGDLVEGGWRQAQRLVDIMDEAPDWWRRGVVIVRIGVNDFGKEALDLLATEAQSPEVRQTMQRCVGHIAEAVRLIRQRHPSTAIVLVGIFNNAHWPDYFNRFTTPQALHNIDTGLDYFDNELRRLAQSQPGIAFFDDRAWFASHWGGRGEAGQLAYRTVTIGTLRVSNTAGDAPANSVLANGHAGLVWNVLWVQALVDELRSTLKLPIEPIADSQVEAFVAATVAAAR